ncbi:MAG: diguanylate cyclase [Actinomycetota bacterium]|jgi:EAL domain-containing protein (putative c-di-GMP-specific phosphodiesterase class I)/heme-degrading monooxygenase HmoA|nr:diguanylate cyclase [Actinomycetota bacterium]
MPSAIGTPGLVDAGVLREAIQNGELVLHYQPKVDLRDGSCRHVEALVRWARPGGGLLYPDSFIPLAETSGLIRELTVWVVREAVRQARSWKDEGLYLGVAVNVASSSLQNTSAIEMVRASLEEFEVSPFSIEIELTESGVMSDPSGAQEMLEQFDRLGVKVSIDDFGTGFSSLVYLRDLPVHTLKIDKSFVMDMTTNDRNRAIVGSTIDLGRALGLRVVAEGVEDEATATALLDLGCDEGQGYFWTKALPAAELTRWLAAFGAQPVRPAATGPVTHEAHALQTVTRLLATSGAENLTQTLVAHVLAVGGTVTGADDASLDGLMHLDLTLGTAEAILPVAAIGTLTRRHLDQTLPLLLTTAQLVLDRGAQDEPAPSSADAETAHGGTGDFVVQSRISVPEAGIAALEDAFRKRLRAVENAAGFRRLEVWADGTASGVYEMVSWWACRADFQAYMKSDDHRRSHARIPRGENRPRAVCARRFTVICE